MGAAYVVAVRDQTLAPVSPGRPDRTHSVCVVVLTPYRNKENKKALTKGLLNCSLMTQYRITVATTEVGWRIRAIFTWMRIVRAAKVQQARRRSSTWRENEQHRLHQLHERSQTAPITTHVRQPYTWHEQTEISNDTGATSGAAAVILKRRRAAVCMNRDAPADKNA